MIAGIIAWVRKLTQQTDFILDTFTDADGVTLLNHMPDIGDYWWSNYFDVTGFEDNGFQISQNKLVSSDTPTYEGSIHFNNKVMPVSDVTVSIDFTPADYPASYFAIVLAMHGKAITPVRPYETDVHIYYGNNYSFVHGEFEFHDGKLTLTCIIISGPEYLTEPTSWRTFSTDVSIDILPGTNTVKMTSLGRVYRTYFNDVLIQTHILEKTPSAGNVGFGLTDTSHLPGEFKLDNFRAYENKGTPLQFLNFPMLFENFAQDGSIAGRSPTSSTATNVYWQGSHPDADLNVGGRFVVNLDWWRELYLIYPGNKISGLSNLRVFEIKQTLAKFVDQTNYRYSDMYIDLTDESPFLGQNVRLKFSIEGASISQAYGRVYTEITASCGSENSPYLNEGVWLFEDDREITTRIEIGDLEQKYYINGTLYCTTNYNFTNHSRNVGDIFLQVFSGNPDYGSGAGEKATIDYVFFDKDINYRLPVELLDYIPATPVLVSTDYFAFNVVDTDNAKVNTVDRPIDLIKHQMIKFGTFGLPGSGYIGDTFIRLVDPLGNEVGVNDDYDYDSGSMISHKASMTGTYTMRVGAYLNTAASGTVVWEVYN